MSHDCRLRAVKLPSFKITSKKQPSSPSTGPPGCVVGGSIARHTGPLSPSMAIDKNTHTKDSGSRDRVDKQHPVAHVSRSRSTREKHNSGSLSGVKEQQRCPPLERRADAASKSNPDYNSEALASWIEAHQQSLSDAIQQLGAKPLAKARNRERVESSFLKKMESCGSSQNPDIAEDVDNKMPGSVGAGAPGVAQFKQRAKSEPARVRHASSRKQDARYPDQGRKFRDKNSRATSEHRRCEPSILDSPEPSILDPPASADSHPLPSIIELTLPELLAELHSVEKSYTLQNTKCGDSNRRKGRSKKSKSKSIQPPLPSIEEQVNIADAGSKNKDNREVQQGPCDSPQENRDNREVQQGPCDSPQERKTGFRFGHVRKKSSKSRVLPTIREDPLDRAPRDPLDRAPREDKTATNQQSGDEASVPKKKSKKAEGADESASRRSCRQCPEPEASNAQDMSPRAMDAAMCGSETKPRRRKSSNLCPKKKPPSGSRREQAAGGNFFQNFADAVGSQLSSIACRNQRFYFPGLQRLYMPDVDLGSLYQPYDDCDDDDEMRSPHRDRSKSPEKEAEEDRNSKSGSSKKRSIQSKSPLSERETDHESEAGESPESPRSDVIIESNISISSGESGGKSSKRKTPLSDVAASDAAMSRKESKRRHTSITSSIRASAKSDRGSKKSSVRDDGSSKSMARSGKESSLRSVKPGTSETHKSKTPSADSQKRSSTKKSSIASFERPDDDKKKTSGATGRETPLPKGSYERSSKGKKVQKLNTPSSKGESSLEDLPESNSETSSESNLSVESQEKHTPTIKHSEVKSPISQQKRSTEVYETENGRIHIEMDQSVSLNEGRKSTESSTSAKSSASNRSTKGNAQIDHSSEADSEPKQPSKPSTVLSRQSGTSKQSSSILRPGKKTPDTLPGTQQFDSPDTIKLSERKTSTARSSKTTSRDSPHSFAPSERQKSQESRQTLVSRERGSSFVSEKSRQSEARSERSQQPESVHSLARSERSQQPESVQSLARSERSQQPESVHSLARSERSQQPESVQSLARSEKSQQPESVQSLARSERSQQPESVQSLARSEKSQQPESVQSLARSERSQQPESVQSLARSERSQQPESVQSLARSERSQQPESVQSLAASERSQQPESVHSLARSEKSQQPESVHTLARSEKSQQPESVHSLARSEKSQQPESVQSLARSEKSQQPESVHSLARSEKSQQPESVQSLARSEKSQQPESVQSLARSERSQQPESVHSLARSERSQQPESVQSLARSERSQQPESVHSLARSERSQQPESIQSLARSERSQQPESVQSLARSERSQQPESVQSLARSERSQQPESVHSLARSDRMQTPEITHSVAPSERRTYEEIIHSPTRSDQMKTPESMHSERSPPIENIYSAIKFDRTPYDSKISVAISEAFSRASKAESRNSYWSAEGKQSVMLSDGTYVIDAMQAIIVSESASSSEHSSSETPHMVTESLDDSKTGQESTYTDKEASEMLISRPDVGSKQSFRSGEWTPRAETFVSNMASEMPASGQSMESERIKETPASKYSMESERLQETPASRLSTAAERLQEMPASRMSTASEMLQEMPASRYSMVSERLQETPAPRLSAASERLQETPASRYTLTPERLQEILTSRHSMASERLQEMSASRRSLATSDRTRDSCREGTATSSKIGSQHPSVDREHPETFIRRSETASKQSYRSAEMTPETHTASRTNADILYETPAYRQSTVSERTPQSFQGLLSSPSKRTSRSPYIDTQTDEVLLQRSLPGSFGSDEMTEREFTSEGRKPGRLSDEQIYTQEKQSSLSSDKQQSTDGRQVYSTSEVNAGRSSASSSQITRTSEKDSRYKAVDFPTPRKPSMIYSDSKRLTPAGIEHGLDEQIRDYKQVFKRHAPEMDASSKIISETQDVARREKRQTQRHDCRCADRGVSQVNIIMKGDCFDDAKSTCSCIQVCSCLRTQAGCLMLKELDCKKECPSSEHTESETEEKSSGRSKLSDRAHDVYQKRKGGHETQPGYKHSELTRSNFKPRCPCESILKGYSTDVRRSFPRDRRSQRQSANPASAKERRPPHCDTSTAEKSVSSHLSDGRTVTNEFSRSSYASKSESGRQRRGEGSESDKTWKQDDTVYGDFDHDDFQATSSEKQSRYDTNDEWEDSSPKEAEFDTSQEAYNRPLRQNDRHSTRRTSPPSTHSSPRAKPSRGNTQQRTAIQDRVTGKYQQKFGNNYVTVTSSNLSTSSKSDCSSLQITVKSSKDGVRKLHTGRKRAHVDGARGYKKASARAMTARYRSDYQDDAGEMLPSRKATHNGDYYSTRRQSGSRHLVGTDMPVSRQQRIQHKKPSSETGAKVSSKSYQTARAAENDGIHASRQYGLELRDRTVLANRSMRQPAFVLPSHQSVSSPSRCQETSSDTSSLPAVMDDHTDCRCRRIIKECERRLRRQTFRPLPMKCDSSDGIPVRKSLSGSGTDNRQIKTNFHLTSRPASRTMSTSPRIDVKVTSSRSSQDASSMEHQVRAKIRRRLPLQNVRSLQSGNTQSLDTGLSGQSSATGASTSDDVRSPNTTSPSPDDLNCEFSEGTPGDQAARGQRIMPNHEKHRSCSDLKKLRGRITFRCSDCSSGRPHSCKCKDAQVAIQAGKMKVIATPSGCRTTSSDKSIERSSTKPQTHTTPADRRGCPLRKKKCLENFLSDSCMDRYEPDSLKHKTKYGLASSYCDPLTLPSCRPFSHKPDFLNRRYSGHRSRSSYHIPSTRYSTYTSHLYNRPPKGNMQRCNLPHNVVAASCQSHSNSASPSPILWTGEPEAIDPFEQIVTPQLLFPRQGAQQTQTYQKRTPMFGQIHIDFEKSMTSTQPWQSQSPRHTDRLYSPSPKIFSHKRFLANLHLPDRGRAHVSRNQVNASHATEPTLTGKTSPSTHARKTLPPIDIVPHLYIGFMSRPRSVAGLLRPPFCDRADELQLRRGFQCSPNPKGNGCESDRFGNSGRPSPGRHVYQSLQYSPSNICPTSGHSSDVDLWGTNKNFSSSVGENKVMWSGGNVSPTSGHSSDVDLWGTNKNFSSSVGENKVMWSGGNVSPTREVSLEVIDNLNLWDTDPVPSSLSLDISQEVDIQEQGDVDDVWVGGNLLQIAQFIPPLPVGKVGNQTLAMIRRNSHKAALYARKLLTSLRLPSNPCSECGVGASAGSSGSGSRSSGQYIHYVLVAVTSSSSHVGSLVSCESESTGGHTTSVNVNSFTSGVPGSASASNHKEVSSNEMSLPRDFDQLTETSSAGAAYGENGSESVSQHLFTPQVDTILSRLSQVPDQELMDSLHGCQLQNEVEKANDCQSLGRYVAGLSGRTAGEQADPSNVTLCEAELSLEEECKLRAAIYKTLRLCGNFTLIPLCCAESCKSKSSLSQEETCSDARSSQHPASNNDEHKREEIGSSKNNFDRHHGLDALVCNQNNNKLKIYIISSEKQKQDYSEEEMPQNASNQHSCTKPMADGLHACLDMYSTVLVNQGCTVPVLGKAYHIFTFDELIRATGKSKLGDGTNDSAAEISMKGQQTRAEQDTVGKQMSGLAEENISISNPPLGQNFLTAEVTIKETDDVRYDMNKPSGSGNFEDVTNDMEHVFSHQNHRYMKKWSCLAPRDDYIICGHLLDRSASVMYPTSATPDVRLFSRNRCENINNSLASPPSNSQDQKPVVNLPPRLPKNGNRSQYDTRHFPTMQRTSSSITGVCSHYLNMPSQYLESSSCNGPAPHGIWNFRRAASWNPTSDHENGVNYELSPDRQTDVDNTRKVILGDPECERDCSKGDAHEKLPPEKLADEICQQMIISPVTVMVTPPDKVSLNSHQVDADSLRSREEIYKDVLSDNDNTCATFLSISSECYSCLSISHKSKSRSEARTDISSLEHSHGDTTLATRDLTYSSNPLGLLEVLISGKLKVIFDKALERWMSPSLRKCSQLTKGSKSGDGKAKTQPETHDSLSSPYQGSASSPQPKEDGQETSSELFASVKESLSEKSITEESFVLLSILSESISASMEKEPAEAMGLNSQGQSEKLAHEATDHKPKKSGPREKIVLSVKRKRIVSESRSHQNKEQEIRGTKEKDSRGIKVTSLSSCNIENTLSESKLEDMKSEPTAAQSDEINKVDMMKAATGGLTDKPESLTCTRLITSTRPSQRYRSQRPETEGQVRGQSVNRPVVSGGSSRKNRSVSNLRTDRARHRRRHEDQAERMSKHAQTGGDRGGRKLTVQIKCSRTTVGKSSHDVCKSPKSSHDVCKSPKSCSSSGASDADKTHVSSLKSEHHSLVGADSRRDTSRGRDKSPVQSTRPKALGTYTEREDRGTERTSATKLDSPMLGEYWLGEPPRENMGSLKNWEINKHSEEITCYSCLPSQDSFRRSHSLQCQQLRAAAIHNNMCFNRRSEHLTRGICMEDLRETECIKSCILTPIQEESLSHDSSACDKSKSDQESLTKDISDTAVCHTNESHRKSKHSHNCRRSTSTHHTPSHRSISVQYSCHEGRSVDHRKDQGHERERSSCTRHHKDRDCQTDKAKAASPDCYEDFLSYLQNRSPFKSAFLRQEMRGLGHWSTPSHGTCGVKNEDELLRTYAGGGTSSSYFKTGKLDLNAYWYHKMKNINMNGAESDQHRPFASSQTDFSSMEVPVLAVTDCTNWTSRTGHLPFLSTSIELGGRSGEMNHRATFLNDHLVNDGTGHLAFSHTSTEPGCRSGELKLSNTLMKDNLATAASANRLPPSRHIHYTSHRRLPAGITSSPLSCGHMSTREWNKSANNGNNEFFSFSSGERDQLEFFEYHQDEACPAAKYSTINIPPDRDATTLPNAGTATNIPPDRDATTLPNAGTATNIPPDRDATILPNAGTATNIPPDRDATTLPNAGTATNIQPDRDATTLPNAGTATNIPPDRDATTLPNAGTATNIPPDRDATTLPNAGTHAHRKTTRRRQGSEHLNGHLKHNLMPCQKILFSLPVNVSGNSNIFHEMEKVNRVYAKRGMRNFAPDQYGENERKVCRIKECWKNDRKVMHSRKNDKRITQLKSCEENDANMIRLKYCRENDRRMCRLKNSRLKFLFNYWSLQTRQTSQHKLLTKFPTHILSIFRICSKHTFCLFSEYVVNTEQMSETTEHISHFRFTQL